MHTNIYTGRGGNDAMIIHDDDEVISSHTYIYTYIHIHKDEIMDIKTEETIV